MSFTNIYKGRTVGFDQKLFLIFLTLFRIHTQHDHKIITHTLFLRILLYYIANFIRIHKEHNSKIITNTLFFKNPIVFFCEIRHDDYQANQGGNIVNAF